MIKLFFRLSFLIFAPLLFLVLSDSYSPISAINQTFIHNRVVDAYKGSIYLVEQKLDAIPQSEWLNQLPNIANNFTYHIKLIHSSDELEYYTGDLSELAADEYLTINDDGGDTVGIVKQMRNSTMYLYMALDDAEDNSVLEAAAGTRALLIELLQKTPKNKWRDKLEDLQPHFGYELSLRTPNQLSELSDEKHQQLEANGATWWDSPNDEIYLYMKAPDSDLILKAGPIALPGSTMLALLLIALVLVVGVSVGILSFVIPLWKDLKKLADSSARFGQGHLTQRAHVGRFSAIKQVATTFDTMAEQIEKMVQGQRELTNAIAHDLRTPLSRLSFAFEMLQSGDISAEERSRYEKSIASGITTLDNLIQQILALSRYSRATDITHFGNHKLGELIKNEVELRDDENPEKHFECNISPELIGRPIFVDQRAMLRAFGNLLTNALRYGNTTIIVCLVEHQNHFILSVEDDGAGIPAEDRQTVFQPFKQLDNDHRESIKGHGLGLAIVQQIADWHDGEAFIETSSIGGAKVVIKWPIKR